MPFESLSFRHRFSIQNFPNRWQPLIHLYDADLPLFPIYYFHAISNQIVAGNRPGFADRVFGYVERINLVAHRTIDIYIITNKDLALQQNDEYKTIAEREVKERLGLNDPVSINDILNAFAPPLNYANAILVELWNRVVTDTYDNSLPFGRLWDEILGLTRFVASWNSPSGRKGELIQTHYFSSKFGERIQSAGNIPHLDFFLLPTISELIDVTNPLNLFPKYSGLVEIANRFQQNNCGLVNIGTISLSRFINTGGKLNTARTLSILREAYIPPNLRPYGVECFNAFDKGPQRTVIFLMMLSDLRAGRLSPSLLNNNTLGSMYDSLKKTYQSPKVLHIYAQQSFGHTEAIPIDVWIETFFYWPLNIIKSLPTQNPHQFLLSHSNNLGKVERLLWVTAQARKVHSSACNDAVWCIKYSSLSEPRGSNPLACKICLPSVRNVCPAYSDNRNVIVVFNAPPNINQFSIATESGNNTTPNQKFISCSGRSIYKHILDDFSPADNPLGFAPYPSPNHNGAPLTLDQFINLY